MDARVSAVQFFQTHVPTHPLIHRTQASERSLETARIALFVSAFYALVLALCRLLPYERSLTSRSIGEALADDALNSTFGALYVIYAKPDAIAIAEVELGKVAVQMLFTAIDASHATFENRVVSFNGIGVDDPAHVFISRMVDGLMHPKFLAEALIGGEFVSYHEGFFRDVSANNRHQLRIRNTVYMEAARFPATSDEGHGDVGTAWSALLLAFLFADEGFINLHDFASGLPLAQCQ
jgi:hypothetical protein